VAERTSPPCRQLSLEGAGELRAANKARSAQASA